MLTLQQAWAIIRDLGDEAAGIVRPRWTPNSPAWEHARERELNQATAAIHYWSNRT